MKEGDTAMLVSNSGRPSPRSAREIANLVLELDIGPEDLRAEIEVYHGESFEPLNGWAADILRRDTDVVVATAIGFSSRAAIRTALLDAGIADMVFID